MPHATQRPLPTSRVWTATPAGKTFAPATAERYHAREGLQSIVQTARGAEAILTSRGRSLSDLLVCADGRHSIARSFFAGGLDAAPAFAGYVLLRAIVPESQLRPGLRERMMSETLHLAATGRHHMVAYPAPGRLLNWGWYYGVRDADLSRLRVDRHGKRIEGTLAAGSLSDETMNRLHRSAEAWSDWPRALAADVLASNCIALHPIYEYASPRLARGAACLLGDAAHLASPITGSGVRLAMLDALALAGAVREAGPDGEAVAALFEDRRRAESRAVVEAGHAHGAIFRVDGYETERSLRQ